jgi:hypothetical protein
VGEDVEIEIAQASGVNVRATRLSDSGEWLITVTNDQARPVTFEAEIDEDLGNIRSSTKLGRRNGRPLWTVTVPANGSASLRYRLS